MHNFSQDLRDAIRSYRDARGPVAAALGALALGAGVAVAVAGLVRGGMTLPRPITYPEELAHVATLGGLDVWSDAPRLPAAIQTESLEAVLLTLLALALLVAAIAFVDAVVLLLTRATARRQELAVRAAVGASRRRLMRQLVTEGGALAVIGGAAGLVLGLGGVTLLRATWPAELPTWLGAAGDPLAAALALAGAFAATLPLALAPVIWRRRELSESLGAGAQTTAPPGEGAARRTLVVGAVGATVAMLIAGGLLVRGTAPGADAAVAGGPHAAAAAGATVDPARVLTVRVEAGEPDPTGAPVGGAEGAQPEGPVDRGALFATALERIAGVSDVDSQTLASAGAWQGVGVVDRTLIDCGGCTLGTMALPMRSLSVRHHAVGPRFFDTLGVRVVRGREFTAHDRADAEPVVVINRVLAREFASDPLGRGIRLGGLQGEWHTIVGIVDELRAPGLGATGERGPALYVSALQHPPRSATFLARVTGDATAAAPSVRSAIAGTAPTISAVSTLARDRASFAAPLRWLGRVFGATALLGLLLAGVALYALLSYEVVRRTREIGLHRAVGATRRRVTTMVVRRGLKLTMVGVALGVYVGLGVARLLQSLFHGVPLLDPAVYGGVVAGTIAVALVAAVRPARRAARLDPAEALRAE